MYFSVFDDDSRLQKIKEIKKDFRERVYKSKVNVFIIVLFINVGFMFF